MKAAEALSHNTRSGAKMRQQILCDPPEGEEWRDRTCIDRTCQKCGATDASGFLKQMGISSVEATSLQKVEVSYERWQREDPDNADSAYDFIRVQKPFAVFIAEMQTVSMRNMSNTMSSQFGKTVTGATSAGTSCEAHTAV